jgi:hypothetical protein
MEIENGKLNASTKINALLLILKRITITTIIPRKEVNIWRFYLGKYG